MDATVGARPLHILEPDAGMRDSLVAHLERRGYAALPAPESCDIVSHVLASPAPVIIDMAFEADTVAAISAMRHAGLRHPVLVVAHAATVAVAVAAMRAGASDFMERPLDFERLDALIAPGAHAPRDPIQVLAGRNRLTGRQMGVLRLMAEGLSNKETGLTLRISPKTSERHRTIILRKLGLRNSVQVARLAAGLASGSIVDFAAPSVDRKR